MKIMITDDEGVVFSKHDVDMEVARNLLRVAQCYQCRDKFNDTNGEDVAAEEILDDLAAACRRELRDEDYCIGSEAR